MLEVIIVFWVYLNINVENHVPICAHMEGEVRFAFVTLGGGGVGGFLQMGKIVFLPLINFSVLEEEMLCFSSITQSQRGRHHLCWTHNVAFLKCWH